MTAASCVPASMTSITTSMRSFLLGHRFEWIPKSFSLRRALNIPMQILLKQIHGLPLMFKTSVFAVIDKTALSFFVVSLLLGVSSLFTCNCPTSYFTGCFVGPWVKILLRPISHCSFCPTNWQFHLNHPSWLAPGIPGGCHLLGTTCCSDWFAYFCFASSWCLPS